ncbi:MAG: DUF3467 domain-containing protein [Planctomycetota bacterium]
MSTPNNDPGDSMENMPAVRARVPEHVAKGEISTGVIVVTGGTEFVLDFVRNLPRPNTIVARVVLPHLVMPQFIDALAKNIELFRQRYGELPGSQPPAHPAPMIPQPNAGHPSISQGEPGTMPAVSNQPSGLAAEVPGTTSIQAGLHSNPTPAQLPLPAAPPKRQNPQEIYDELKIRDEILSGTYANAVMIGHGNYEFSFDFITNFYPQSAVSCRVYLASGHIARLLDSLKQSWEQLRPRLGYPPSGNP